jgi:hypothetical protein
MNTPQLLLQIVPSRASSARDLPSLENAIQNLALDERSPVALEVAATATSRQFLLRANSEMSLRHLSGQLQARYPQAVLRQARVDPLTLAPDEECSMLELCPGAAPYLPLRSWNRRDLLEEGADPLLGILASFGALPAGARAVAQLALLPASPTWSAQNRRRAVEHPLEQERARQSQGTQAPPNLHGALLLFLLAGVLALVARFHQTLLPSWVLQAGSQLAQGHPPRLTGGQLLTGLGAAFGLFLLSFLAAIGLSLWGKRFSQPAIYDQQLVGEKTMLPAYRVRLRLFVMTPGEPRAVTPREEESGTSSGGSATGTVGAPPGARARLRALYERLVHPALHPPTDKQVQRAQREERARARRARREREQQRQELLRMLAASYRQYHLAAGGYFRARRVPARRVRRLLALVRGFPRLRFWWSGWPAELASSTHLLSIADLAALWHLPQAQDLADLNYVEHEGARTILAPTVLTTTGGYRIGESTHAGQTMPILLPFSCLLQNMLVVASTGKGKSSLFFLLMQVFFTARLARRQGTSDASVGGLVLIDPHGDLTDLVLGCVPTELEEEVVLIDLANSLALVGLNPLDMSRGQNRDKVVDNLIRIVEAIWSTSYGPRTENILEYACKTLAEANLTLVKRDPFHGADQQFTLLDVLSLLRRRSFRHAIFELVEDQVLLDWWKHYYEPLDLRQQSEYTSSVLTKLSKFASTRTSRRMLGQPRSTIDLGAVIREEKILLVNCASGEVGGDLAALIGSLLVGLFQVALAEQARLDVANRHRVLILIDEFQALAGVDYQTMLAELRKYGGAFALATQSLAYLERIERTLRATVLANTEHIFAFAMSPDDARLLHLDGVEPEDLTRLPDYECYARIGLDGRRFPPFSLRLDPPLTPDAEQRRRIQDRCRSRYAMLVGEIDEQLRSIRARQETMRPQTPSEDPLEEGAQQPVRTERKRGTRTRGRGGKNTSSPPDNLIHNIYHAEAAASPSRKTEAVEMRHAAALEQQADAATRREDQKGEADE